MPLFYLLQSFYLNPKNSGNALFTGPMSVCWGEEAALLLTAVSPPPRRGQVDQDSLSEFPIVGQFYAALLDKCVLCTKCQTCWQLISVFGWGAKCVRVKDGCYHRNAMCTQQTAKIWQNIHKLVRCKQERGRTISRQFTFCNLFSQL